MPMASDSGAERGGHYACRVRQRRQTLVGGDWGRVQASGPRVAAMPLPTLYTPGSGSWGRGAPENSLAERQRRLLLTQRRRWPLVLCLDGFQAAGPGGRALGAARQLDRRAKGAAQRSACGDCLLAAC